MLILFLSLHLLVMKQRISNSFAIIWAAGIKNETCQSSVNRYLPLKIEIEMSVIDLIQFGKGRFVFFSCSYSGYGKDLKF